MSLFNPFAIQNLAPCKFFLSGQGCKFGSDCKNSHNVDEIIKYYQLQKCPNFGCTNYCQGRQCKSCHQARCNTNMQCTMQSSTNENTSHYNDIIDFFDNDLKTNSQTVLTEITNNTRPMSYELDTGVA